MITYTYRLISLQSEILQHQSFRSLWKGM